MGDYIASIDALLELAGQIDLERFRNLHPELSRRPDGRHLRTPDARREGAYGSALACVRVCAEQDHSRDDVVLEKMLVRDASLYQPDSVLLGKVSHHMVKIGYFLVGSWERVVYYQMDPGRVPDLRDAHLAEHLDSERPSTILGHGHIGRQNRDFSWMMYLLAAFGSNA